jgi:glycosyltransferase involved in cell wall biosynthesis
MRVLFVGPLSGFTSYPVVCKGLLQALTGAGFDVDVADTSWDGSPDHTAPELMDDDRSLNFLERKDVVKLVQQGEHSGGEGDVCVVVNPTHHMMAIKEKGYKIAGMFVGDVDKIPGAWQAIMQELDIVLTPSSWGKQVIDQAQLGCEVLVLNHGVSPLFTTGEQEIDDSPFVFLHTCSAIYFPERKGTPQTLTAFERLVEERDDVVLRLVFGGRTRPMRKILNALEPRVKERLQVHFREGAREPAEIRRAYLSCHAGLFPSRAEGMGMMPLEMRSCGVPVIQTFCTGHADHLDSDMDPREWGITPVLYGEMSEAWGKFGRAPTVLADDVYESMLQCIENYPALRAAALDKADAVRANWSWESTTQPLVNWIKDL